MPIPLSATSPSAANLRRLVSLVSCRSREIKRSSVSSASLVLTRSSARRNTPTLPTRAEPRQGELTMWHEYRSMMRLYNTRSESHDQQGLSSEDNSWFRWVSCPGLADPLLRRQRWSRWSAPSDLPDNKNLSGQRNAASECDRPTRRDGKRSSRPADSWRFHLDHF